MIIVFFDYTINKTTIRIRHIFKVKKTADITNWSLLHQCCLELTLMNELSSCMLYLIDINYNRKISNVKHAIFNLNYCRNRDLNCCNEVIIIIFLLSPWEVTWRIWSLSQPFWLLITKASIVIVSSKTVQIIRRHLSKILLVFHIVVPYDNKIISISISKLLLSKLHYWYKIIILRNIKICSNNEHSISSLSIIFILLLLNINIFLIVSWARKLNIFLLSRLCNLIYLKRLP